MFRLRSLVNFPMRFVFLEAIKISVFQKGLSSKCTPKLKHRITAFLDGGREVAIPSAQLFQISETSDLDVVFPFLRQQKNYGRLCILEEPLVSGYTTMGRLISGITLQKCYFENLKTKDYELSILDSEASPYKRSLSVPLISHFSIVFISFLLSIYFNYFLRIW